jgi:hypothetical protein
MMMVCYIQNVMAGGDILMYLQTFKEGHQGIYSYERFYLFSCLEDIL